MTIMTPLTGGQDQSLIKGRAVWVPQVPWNGSGAKSFADHGRWKVDDLRAGSIRGFITYCEQKHKWFESDHHQNLYLKLQGFAAFSCASY